MNWLSPVNKISILRAVREEETSVQFADGRKFVIEYDGAKVFIRPDSAYGHFPCGWFDKHTITKLDWLSE